MQFWKGWYESRTRLVYVTEVIIPCSFGRAGMSYRQICIELCVSLYHAVLEGLVWVGLIMPTINPSHYTMQFWKGWYELTRTEATARTVIIPCSFGRAGMSMYDGMKESQLSLYHAVLEGLVWVKEIDAILTHCHYTMQFWKGWYELFKLLVEIEIVIIPCSFGRAGMSCLLFECLFVLSLYHAVLEGLVWDSCKC